MSTTIWFEESLDNYSFPTRRIIDFCNYLRGNGVCASISDAVLMADVLRFSENAITSKRVELMWRPIVCKTLKDWRLWPALFQAFWFPHTLKGTVKLTGSSNRTTTLKEAVMKSKSMCGSSADVSSQVGNNPGVSNEMRDSEQRQKSAGGASLADPCRQDSKGIWIPLEHTVLERLARTVKDQLLNAPTRRWQTSSRGRILNLRKTTQNMIRLGGDGVIPVWQKQRSESPHIVMAIDVSRSMESYAEFYLRLARAFSRWLPIRVFVFHMHCAEVTEFLLKDNPKMHKKIVTVTAGFQGGTKIASSLNQICFDAEGVNLNRRTRLWIFSDGFDTDNPETLLQVLKRVRGKGTSINWFYPNKSVADMGCCVQLIKPLINSWHGAANLAEIEQSASQIT